jgi:hypothetical protein
LESNVNEWPADWIEWNGCHMGTGQRDALRKRGAVPLSDERFPDETMSYVKATIGSFPVTFKWWVEVGRAVVEVGGWA